LDYADRVFVFVGRATAALAGIAITGLSLFGAVWFLIAASLAAQWPGKACCGRPESWGDLGHQTFVVLTMASTDAIVFAAGVALLGYATERRWPRWRTLRWFPLGTVAGTAALMALAVVSS
jgi:hypothetical protein